MVLFWVSSFLLLVFLVMSVVYQKGLSSNFTPITFENLIRLYLRKSSIDQVRSVVERTIGAQLLVTLSDLERDYINAHDGVVQVNRAVYVEAALQLIVCLLFLFSGHWFMFLFSIPIIYYSIRMYMRGQHKVSEVDIFGKFHQEKTRRLIKLVTLVVPLCLSLFWLIWSVLEDDDFHTSSDQWSHS